MADAYVVGQAIGFATPVMGATWFAVRQLLGSAGSREVTRLQAIAAGEKPPSATGNALKTLAPIAAALVAGAFCIAFVLVKGSFAIGAPKLPVMKQGFVIGCTKTCVQAGSQASWCNTMCTCVVDDIAKRHGEEGMKDWYRKASTDQEMVKRDAAISRDICLQTLPPQ